MITNQQIKKLLPKRTKFSNKTSGGKVLIVGGGRGLYGAGLISALAATRMGAGYTHLMTDLTKFPWVKFPDFILHPIKISELKNKEDFAIGIGPGLGIEEKNKKLINYLIKNNFTNVVADADALTLIAKYDISPLPSSWILTPHEGELARLLKTKSSSIKKDRLTAIKTAQEKFGCTILLKGAITLIATPKRQKILSVQTGTPALSKAGTGDVLLGMIVALRAQGLKSCEACLVATYVHGLSSQEWERAGNDHLSLRPIDLIERLPKTIKLIRDKK
ncbi:MAG: NAD(P)H-hydrate dehydratase [Bacteriovorax sp.]|nr:NAD(P)H-hydrate dehydratase [Bacteriovorax sp.]